MENWIICQVYIFLLLVNSGHMVYMVFNDTVLKYRMYSIILGCFKAAYSVTMNIFRKKYFLFKSFVKVE